MNVKEQIEIDDDSDIPEVLLDSPSSTGGADDLDSNSVSTVKSAVERCLNETKNKEDPVEVLQVYQQLFLKGRPLDQDSLDSTIEGKTLPIFVSRNDILETGMSELVDSEDFRYPMEVTFYGEEAADVGGPRKEFLVLMLQEILKDERNILKEVDEQRYKIIENSANLRKKFYYGAGLLCGLSLLQNGPLPCFLSEEESENVIMGTNATPARVQFRRGFDTLGLVELLRSKPTLKYLLRPSAKKLLTTKVLSYSQAKIF
ncbi:uncharacterized protein LOC117099916 [Anneissia japonica]|uniref:uncharacterized protein LOC117099916 n=1 Tax=Anneissia japonica TaxID=1529436 RepID=UPI001425B5B8|nr:uncharacterized protein LOC117099916 [Anneissia japonica]